MMDETLNALLAIRTRVAESAVTSESPDEIRMYIMIGKTAMFVDTMSTMLPITTPFREIRFIRRLTLPGSTTNSIPVMQNLKSASAPADGKRSLNAYVDFSMKYPGPPGHRGFIEA